MNIEEVKAAEAKLRRARSSYERARQQRNEAVRQALAEGMKPADIARATGLTRGRIAQIASGAT
jgi:DNA-directed RNA polymerase specialized sigma24 family protein